LALIEEAQAEMLEDEKEKFKKQSLVSKSINFFYANFFHVFESFERLLDDFGRNFHGYIRYVSITIIEVRT